MYVSSVAFGHRFNLNRPTLALRRPKRRNFRFSSCLAYEAGTCTNVGPGTEDQATRVGSEFS
jgi:hypothetical protein